MSIINQVIGYLSDAAAVIFDIDRVKHPVMGTQAFTGEISRRRRRRN
jgi:hypothetical protein